MSNYLLELAVIHSALMLGYWFFLRKERQYATLRFYLLGSTLLALTIPLLKLPKLFSSPEPIYAAPAEALSLEAITVIPTANESIWNSEVLIGGYLMVSAFFLLKFLGSVLYIVYLERRSHYEIFDGVYIRKIQDIEGSFTFFNWIFLNADINKNQPDYNVILKHEQAHATLGHTYDVLFFELFKVCFWWLPTAWLTTQEIKKIHEYQADAYALKSYSIDQYSSILISSTLKSNGLSLASSFHDGLIKKRLTAMKNQAKNVSLWKLGALSALGALLFIAFACSEELDQEIKEMGNQSNAISFYDLPADMQTGLREIKDQLSFMKVDVPEGKDISDVEKLQNLDPELIHTMNVNKIDRTIYLALKKEGVNFNYLADMSRIDGELFTVVEEMPEYVGGMDAFYQYVANEVKYPAQARQQSVEGHVFVQFVVEKDGSLTDVQVIKGIGAGCDQEAVRVVENSPAFKPGKQRGKPVRVRMVMPITFILNGDNLGKQEIIEVAEAKVVNNTFTVNADYADGKWSGTIYAEDGKGFPGANIVVAGATTGTVSDLDGNFSVEADKANDLYISAVGYERVKIEGE
ncbi:TonB family protein [Tunicatimonas pelagia]|uniref:TonB family protein n=1 Tax=Tunicatimonas pelagia TaxID=931531 RepID=UPI002666F87A|nr:TonB family protein [Tunicatimonas pelagia]WKN43552.1 TonB family protein [Tunicatimonas pelagia]